MTGKPIRTTVLLAVLTVLFYWKTLLTNQYTLLRVWEGVSQGYGWLSFAVRSIRHGQLPLWDPYTMAGHSFIGEMQTSGLSPFNLILALVPTDSHGLLPAFAYHVLYAFLRFLGLAFGYALARELRLKPFAAILTGLCFSMGGFLVRVLDWPDLVQSGIWLPLMMLFLVRALRSQVPLTRWYNSALAGFVIGLAILGGRLHMVMMEVMVVATASAFYVWQGDLESEETPSEPVGTTNPEPLWPRLVRHGLIVAIVGLVTVGTGALQLFPSLSYTPKAIHYYGEHNGPASVKIPYADLTAHSALPNSIAGFIFPFGFNGAMNNQEYLLPYIGVLPFLLAVYALITRWRNPWVRYFGFLALASTLYSFGPFSALHGLMYAVVPKLWWMREAGRMVYLTSFGLAVLAGFGADGLFRSRAEKSEEESRARVSLRFFDLCALGLVIASVAALLVGSAVNWAPNAWIQLSFVLIFLAYGVYRAAAAGKVGTFTQCFAVFVVMFDLANFDWTMQDKAQITKEDQFVRLLSCENAAKFLKSIPGPFRVSLIMDEAPALGDVFEVLTTKGASATLMTDFREMMGRPDLLDVQYVMRPAAVTDPNPVYQDANWKIYHSPQPYGHAWLNHKAILVPAKDKFSDLWDPKVNYREVATSSDRLDGQLDPGTSDGESVRFLKYEPNHVKLTLTSKGRGLLVLSEIYDADWKATVNGQGAAIHEVDGGLRGIVVPNGPSMVEMDYLPASVVGGGVLTGLTFLGMLGFGLFVRRRNRVLPKHESAVSLEEHAVA